ncbi:MAG: hypothetical protein IKT03_08605 [Muribaculaceae bacterium]|nr:hypothetical protein [Muribaculaceae bacterium]MBR6490577.1 hypothetical protein [Muribaculaceae bacterium]
MKNIVLTLMMVVAISLPLTAADDGGKKSTIHLRNGQTVEGTITSRNDQQVEITTTDGVSYTYSMSDVDHISHEARKKNYDTAKFRGFIDLGYSLGVGAPRNDFWLIETSFGYAITPKTYIGAGIGIHSFKAVVKSYPMRTDRPQLEENDPEWRYPFIPIYAEGRYSFKNESYNTPWVSLKVGATFINHKGFYTSPSIGYHFKSNQFFSFNVGVGYALHTAHYKLWCTGDTPGAIGDDKGGSYLDKNAMFHNFFLKVGVEF